MSKVTYKVNGTTIESVEIEATYSDPRHIPIIGQRRRMQVNGGKETLTLNEIKVRRRSDWNEDKERFYYLFDTTEEWGEYHIS
jgi:hypothetical protein